MLRSSSGSGLLSVLALVCCLPLATLAQVSPDGDVYTVQPGDTCATIGRKVFGDAGKGSERLHALNKMGPPPHTLVPGTVLRIRGEPDAHLTFVKPEVNAKRAGNTDWRQASTGQSLWRLDSVNTLREAGAEMTFRDLTRLKMNENALVVLYGDEAQATDKVKKSGGVELLQGELSLSLADLRGEPVGVKMPAATVAAKSKDLLVGVDAQQMSRLSVYDGQAQVDAQGKSVQVPLNHGTRVEKGKAPEPPRPLPPAPVWEGGVRSVRLLLADSGVDETLAWAPVKEAASYRVELARDEHFNDQLLAETVPAGPGALQVVAHGLAPGQYLARVRAVDGTGLVGLASEVRHVEVLRVKTQFGKPGAQGLQGSSRVEFAVDDAEALDFRLDGVPTTHPVRVESVGSHTLEIRPRGMPDAPPEKLTLTVIAPQVALALKPQADAWLVTARVLDDQGQPLEGSQEALKLRGLEGTEVSPPQRRADGAWLARAFPAPAAGERVVAVEALWGDTSVQQARLRIPAPPPPAIAPEVALVSLLGVPTGGAVETEPLPTAFLPQAWLFELREQAEVGSGGVDVAGGRTTLAVDGRLSERVALGGTLAVRPGSLLGDAERGAPALSASLSGRVSVWESPQTARVLLAFDGTWANPHFEPEARGLRLRPALIAGGRWARWAFSTSQAYALRPGEARAAWDSSYQAWFHALPLLVVGAELEAVVDATPTAPSPPPMPGPTALAAGVGARWKLGRFEVGLSARRGFGPEASRVWGGWSGQVTLGVSGLRALSVP